MSRPTYTAYANHPRILFRDTDLPWIIGQGNPIYTEGNLIATKIYNGAISLKSPSDASLTQDKNDYHVKALTLCMGSKLGTSLFGITESGMIAKAISSARYAAQTVAPSYSSSTDSSDRRSLVFGMALVFDILYSSLSSDDKTVIATGIMNICGKMRLVSTEMMDGHSAGDQAFRIIGALAILGEPGFDSGGSDAKDHLNQALDYWYGGDNTLTKGGVGRLGYNRYFNSNGGAGKGTGYEIFAGWYTVALLESLQNALSTMTLDGDTYTLPTSEAFIDRWGEWFLNTFMRGDFDFWKHGDTQRLSNPLFAETEHLVLAYLISASPTWRRNLRWHYDTKYNKAKALGQSWYASEVMDFCLFDRANATFNQLAPNQTTPEPIKSRLFEPPGSYWFRKTWDTMGPSNCIINIHCPTYWFGGHNADLDCGQIQINLKDDMVLLDTGLYKTEQVDVSDLGGTHTNNWARQSISKSGIPLVDDLSTATTLSPIETSTPHVDRNPAGNKAAFPHAQGGQLWKAFDDGGAWSIDPDTTEKMYSDGGGMAWRRTVGINGETDRGIEIKADTADFCFITADIRRAYLKKSADIDTAAERLTMCQMKWMIIKNEGNWPCIFRVARVRSRVSTFIKRDVWHFWGSPTINATNGTFSAIGFIGTGKCLIAYHNFVNYGFSQVGGGDATTIGSTQFAYTIGSSSTLNNFPPTGYPNSRYMPDIGRFRVEVKPTTAQTEDNFVCLIMPLATTDSNPDYTFFEETDYWGVRFGGVTSQRIYKIHKTQALYQGPAEAIDTTAPTAPTGFSAIAGPGSGQVSLSWNPAPEVDAAKHRACYRIKV